MPEMPHLNWTKSIFSSEEAMNRIWKNWAGASLRSSQELMKIVYGEPYQEEFQKRALFLLLVPYTKSAPFYWQHQVEPCNYLGSEVDFRKVDPALRAHAIYWLTKFIDYAKFHPINSDYRVTLLDAYNKYILHLLEVLPVEDNQAETVFSYLSLNDPTPCGAYEDRSGYNPLYALWKNPKINERWKKSAETEIRQIIKSELRGDSTPREPYENALKCYARDLQLLLLYKSPLPYGKELLAEQLNFLTSLEVSNLRLIRPESIALIIPLFEEERERYQDLLTRFIRFAVLRDGNFQIYNEKTEEAAQTILRECDPQIHCVVQDQLNAYRQSQNVLKEIAENKKIADDSLLAPMKKPDDIPLNKENQSEQ